MPRYEFVEGTSNKFWEISLEGKSFRTTWGKRGATGQTTRKRFASVDTAKTQHDKLIREKVKKGYTLVGAAGSKKALVPAMNGTLDARNPQLESAVVLNPADREAFAVLGDWLEEQGDPRGELIALQLGNKDKQAKALIEKRADYFLGPLAAHQKVHDDIGPCGRSHLRTREQEAAWKKVQAQAFLWRNGYISRVRLSHFSQGDGTSKGKTVDVLNEVLRHPSARFAVEFAFMSNGAHDANLEDLIDALGKKAPPTVRKLTFGDNIDQISWHHTGSLGKLWRGVPGLRTLEVETGEFEVGKMVAPALERAVFITGGLSKSCGRGIATATMPNIKHLEIYYGTRRYGAGCSVKEVQPLLNRTDLPNLRYLGLKNSEFANGLAAALAGAKVLKTLQTLDLSLGVMTDAGARSLAAAKKDLAHLEVLDLTHNYLTGEGIEIVKGLCKKVITADQQTNAERETDDDDDADDVTYRFVAVGE